MLPKIYKGRNRTFFLFSWDALREINGSAERALVPTPEMLRGDFSKATDTSGRPLVIMDAVNRIPFQNNQIPANRLDPVAVKTLKYLPAPNFSAGPYNFITQGNATNSFNSFGVKLDQLFDKDRLTFGAFWRTRDTLNPIVSNRSPLPYFGSSNTPHEALTYIRYLRTMTPTMYLEASANFSRRTNREVWPHSGDSDNWARETGFNGVTNNPVAAGPPYIILTGYMPIGPAYDIPKIWAFNNYQYAGTLTWIRGAHSFKFGGDLLRMQYFSRSYGDTPGRVNFLGRFTGHPVADFLLGWVDNMRRQLDATGPYHLVSNYSAFLQDDFKVSPTLTLNLGVRYDLMKPPKEKYNALAEFIPALGKIVVAGTGTISEADFENRIMTAGLTPYVVRASDAGLPETIVRTDWNNFAPRFGFAWRMFGNKTVLRGGYGIFYGSSSLYRMDEYNDTYPFGVTETFSRVGSDPLALTLSNPFPTDRRGFSGVTSSYGQESDSPANQYLQSWSLSIERELWRGLVVEMAYAGSKGTHLQRRYDINQAGRTREASAVRPYPAFGTIQIINDGSNSIYNSGQFTVRQRLSKQLFVRGSYTWAKSIDESSNTGGTIAYNFSSAQDSRNLKLERGRSDFDIGHTFAASFIWSPNFLRNRLARDWQLAGTSTIYTGPPFTPRVATVNYLNGEATRPDRITKGTADNPTVDHWFDRGAFVVVPTGSYRFGNYGRNILDGPGAVIINASLSRRFRFGESRSIQYRLESFNLPNHPNFNLPENNVDLITAGTIRRVKTAVISR